MRNFLWLFLLTLSTTVFGQRLEERYLVHQERIRDYLLYIPAAYDENQASSLVFIFHGLGASPENMQVVQFNEQAELHNYIIAYPRALDSPFSYAWNSGTLLNMNIDDVGFTQNLITTLSDEFNINDKRIYACGFSMGGIMSQRLGCELGNTFAAVASVSGPLATAIRIDCQPERSIPVMYFHGTNDGTVPYTGSAVLGTSAVYATMDKWQRFSECDEEPLIEQVPDTTDEEFHVEKQTYQNCNDDIELVHWKIYDWPHSWPRNGRNVNATIEIANFFNRHELPELEMVTPAIENELPDGWRIGPNPFDEVLNIHPPSVMNGFNWRLINISGQIMIQGQDEESLQLSTQKLPSGLYVFEVYDRTQLISHKMIKMK